MSNEKTCGILLLTHGTQGESLLETASHMLGECPEHSIAVNLLGSERRSEIEKRSRQAVAQLLDEAGRVLLLSDLFGSTQAVIADKIATEEENVACVHGVNLAMLLEAVGMRHLPLAQLRKQVVAAGKQSVISPR